VMNCVKMTRLKKDLMYIQKPNYDAKMQLEVYKLEHEEKELFIQIETASEPRDSTTEQNYQSQVIRDFTHDQSISEDSSSDMVQNC